MKACCLLSLVRKSAPFSLQRLAPFSSSASANPRSPSYSSDEEEYGSVVYRHALKFQRPPTISRRRQDLYSNSVSFIGSVWSPPKVIAKWDGGIHAVLAVRTSPESEPAFTISLCMWDEMAEISLRHLKFNDFIYVSGHLGSYEKADENGKLRTYHKVIVKELNFVTPRHQGAACQKFEESQSQKDLSDAGSDKYKERLHLWQAFFANPSKWWDARETKKTPRHPDFEHKDTGEVLWLNPHDPPWIKKQLELLDLQMAEQGQGEAGTEKYKTDLHLWQVFFTDPYEWWDARETKRDPRKPDFVHKHSGEALWLNPDDPPWIKKQLESLVLQTAKLGQDEAVMEKHRNDLYLWQAFFTNPYEWWDARETKKNPRHPDFVHKHSGEALWLNPDDPPWIKEQLESLDLQMAKQGRGEAGLEKYKDDLHLWQVFFSNPHEWWDNRKKKKNPRAPDFRHKDTGEALWLSPNDPPWIRKQLESLDLRMAEQGLGEHVGRRSRLSEWKYD